MRIGWPFFRLELRSGDYGVAEAAARKSIALDDTIPEPLINLALVYQEKADLGQRIVILPPGNRMRWWFPEAHFTLGVINLTRGWHEEAIACFERVLEILPEDPNALINISNVYRERMEISTAGAYYQRAAERSPDLAAAHSNLGIVLKDQGKMDAALGAFKRSWSLTPITIWRGPTFSFAFALKSMRTSEWYSRNMWNSIAGMRPP